MAFFKGHPEDKKMYFHAPKKVNFYDIPMAMAILKSELRSNCSLGSKIHPIPCGFEITLGST